MRPLGAAAVFVALAVVADVLSEEVRGRLDRLPHAVIRLASRRLDPDIRADVADEWTAELQAVLDHHRAAGLPVTRLLVGIRFAAGLLRSGGAINRDLVPRRPRHNRLVAYVPAAVLSAAAVAAVGYAVRRSDNGIVAAMVAAVTMTLLVLLTFSFLQVVAGAGAVAVAAVAGLVAAGVTAAVAGRRAVPARAARVVIVAFVATLAPAETGVLAFVAASGDSWDAQAYPHPTGEVAIRVTTGNLLAAATLVALLTAPLWLWFAMALGRPLRALARTAAFLVHHGRRGPGSGAPPAGGTARPHAPGGMQRAPVP